MRALVFICLFAAPLAAQECPPPRDIGADLSRLIAEVRQAESEAQARGISNRMWHLWAEAPNAQAQEVLDRGMRRRAAFDLLGAISDFDRLVEYCPDYAEGYNQRAFAQFIRQDYAAALRDLDRALALSPRHIGALVGKSMTLVGLGRNGEAALVLRKALELNPWLPERRMLATLEGGGDEL